METFLEFGERETVLMGSAGGRGRKREVVVSGLCSAFIVSVRERSICVDVRIVTSTELPRCRR